ncbi:DUF992 domain-containing protein [Pseudohoeflea coraliihabitans]|uniref:DUF992 domain-containing protein n=1 Tax=Pseudohoeflea coraliihabitans TaxID=2860393 RepID=A0ABS6WIV0_9HYPH|nr:DUF992 domain-containing protein [Pseudohoeflea sp. DP4N28-3]MBW3095863.1 DUF992 domain-containing protein [Pseudohoeflea sp. DP4N28-3]
MPRTRPTLALLSASALAATLFTAPVSAQVDTVEVGALNCVVEGGGSFIFGSSRDLACTFTSAADPDMEEVYVGQIDKFGIDLGVTGTTLMSWAVVAPANSDFVTGALAGQYVGATASASFAAGLGANVLVSSGGGSIALQPVSVQAQEGVNVAAGIAQLTLVGTQG